MNKAPLLLLTVLLSIAFLLQACGPRAEVTPETGGQPIKIGFIAPLTGDAANLGQNSRAAVEIAVEEINNAGGINGRNVEVVYEDGKCNAKEASNAANKLVNVDGVSVIIGGLCSSETIASTPIAEGKTVLLSPCSSNPSITTIGDHVFRDYPSDSFQAAFAAEFAYNNLNARNAAVLYCLSDWCVGLREVFSKRFKELGGNIVIEDSFEQESRDLRTQFTKIKDKNPAIIYMPSYTEATIVGLVQAKELGIDTPFLGGDAWDDPKIFQETKGAAEGIMYVVPSSPDSPDFKEKMKQKTGEDETTICAAQAYDAAHIIAGVMRKHGMDFESIKQGLYAIKDYSGVSGMITFDENGDLAEASYIVKVVRGITSEEYKPEAMAEEATTATAPATEEAGEESVVVVGSEEAAETTQQEAPAAAPSVKMQTISITENEWGILPGEIRAKAGKIKFVVANRGSLAHSIEIEGKSYGKDFEYEEEVPIDGSVTFELDLSPGQYEVYCPVPGHEEKGMKALLIVE